MPSASMSGDLEARHQRPMPNVTANCSPESGGLIDAAVQ
jgi:hypothetical protein